MSNKYYSILSWFSGEPDEVSNVAQNILDAVEDDDNEDLLLDAKLFYEDVASEKCHFSGRDGSHNWCWATYSRMNLTVIFSHIRPFFMKLWEQNIISPIHTVMGIDQDEMSNYTTFYILTDRDKLNSWRNDQVRWAYDEFVEPDTEWQYDIEYDNDQTTITLDNVEISYDDDIEYNFQCSNCNREFMNAASGTKCPYCENGWVYRL